MTLKEWVASRAKPNDPNQPAHSKLGASSMKRWKTCPASVRASTGVPEQESEFAIEGTEAHEVAAYVLEEGHFPQDVTISDEMISAVTEYVLTIEKDREEFNNISHMQVEVRFDLSALYPGCFGTADAVVHWPARRFLRVYDFKYGAGIMVDAEDSDQLMYYALGALRQIKFPVDEVELVIVQPRCHHEGGPVRRWKFPAVDILGFEADLVTFAKNTEDPNAPFVPGDHCRFCPAAATNCNAIHNMALEQAAQEFSPVFSYDPEKLAKTLATLPAIEAWIKKVREFAYGEALHGRPPPGFKLVAKRATRKWKDSNSAAEALLMASDLLETAIFEEPTLKSPAQIEKLLPKKQHFILDGLVVAESSGEVLAPDSDGRPAIKADPQSEFKAINNSEAE